ncbi:trithorax group protein osa-like [Anopheles maculipalpis]|uniref:trithorax group protein osa-like n=1 Tax=Anopheles maculipalpis TaxID=1496333 RepID=UPI002158BF1C|nr:trithorax group protein osa-like [Anopheles maculipalpis]
MIRMVRLNLIVWISCCACLLLQAPWVVAAGHDPPPGNRPIQLEDIERDNLNSERQVFKKEAIEQQQQHGASSTQSNNHYTVQIQHHPGSAAGTHSSVKYVTPLPAPTQTHTYTKDHAVPQQLYINIPQQPSHHQQQHQQQQQQQQQQVPQVHEDHSTYTVPSRQSLLQPVIGGGAPASPYLTPQPQYVYVQARPQQLPQQYAADHALPQSLLHILPQNSQAYIMIPTPYYQQQPHHIPSSPTGPAALPSIAPAPSSGPPHSAQQLAAYVNDPDNHIQTYSHGETGAHSPGTAGPSTVQPTPQPDIVYAASSTPSPPRHQSPSAEFSIVKSVEQPVYFSHDLPPVQSHKLPQLLGDGPQHHHFAAPQLHHPTGRPYLSHAPSPQHLHHPAGPVHYPAYVQQPHGHSSAGQSHSFAPQFYPSLAHPNNGILNYFGVQHRPPTSLLDSYVPSSLQLAKTPLYTTKLTPHGFGAPHQPIHQAHHQRPVHFYQPGAPVYPLNPLHTTILQPAGGQHAQPLQSHAAQPLLGQLPTGPATAPGYNTIAYSVPLAFTKTSAQYKRSPGLFSVAGFPKPSPLATTKLQPAKQFQ